MPKGRPIKHSPMPCIDFPVLMAFDLDDEYRTTDPATNKPTPAQTLMVPTITRPCPSAGFIIGLALSDEQIATVGSLLMVGSALHGELFTKKLKINRGKSHFMVAVFSWHKCTLMVI